MSLREFIQNHPRITLWIILAVGMVALMLWASKDVESLLWYQRLALALSCVGLAGLCVWIISWES